MLSVVPVVFVKVTVLPDAGMACTGLALVVMSFATQKKLVDDEKAGLMPVMVDVFEANVAIPAIQ